MTKLNCSPYGVIQPVIEPTSLPAFRVHMDDGTSYVTSMAAGVSDHVWEISDLVGLLEREEAL